MRRLIIALYFELREWWLRRRLSTRSLPHHLWTAFKNYSEHGANRAAALAYYAIFSMFPLLLLLTMAVIRLLGEVEGPERLQQGLRIFLPQQTVSVVQDTVMQTVQLRGDTFQIVAIIGLLWSALGFFSNLSEALDDIFQVTENRSMWRQRLLAFFMTLILIALAISSLITSGVLRLFAVFFLDRPSVWINVGTFFLPFGINLLIFVMLFRYVPSRHVYWEAIWPAALFGAAGWELAKAGFAWYVTNFAKFELVYGGISAAIVLLFSVYISLSILLIAAELCARLNEWLSGQTAEHQLPSVEQRLSTLPRIKLPTLK